MASTVTEVFGVSSSLVGSYIERSDVDRNFLEALKSDKQIVVYGASKQGKTALVSRHLPYDKSMVVNLTPNTSIIDIYQSMLRKAGIKVKVSETQGTNTEGSVSLSARFKAIVPFLLKGETEAMGKISTGVTKEQIYEEIPFNLELAQDVTEMLRYATKEKVVVILENFHYLDDDKQKRFAYDLRTFQELKVQFVILGVWREKNRLAQFNGDLLDRVTEVPVEPWTDQEFDAVADKGLALLNLTFSPALRKKLIEASCSSIGVFQELLKETCLAAGITERCRESKLVSDENFVETACQRKASDYAARHQRALEAIAAGNISASSKEGVQPLYLPYYLVRAILSEGIDGIANGMTRTVIQSKIQAIHHRGKDVRASDMSNLLYNLAKTQANKFISPPIIDYDQSKRMIQIVDSTFYFFLKHADLNQISLELPNPIEGGRTEQSDT